MTVAALVAASVTPENIPDTHKFTAVRGAANALDNSALQDVFTIKVAGLVRLALRIVVATNALAEFAILGRFNGDSDNFSTLKDAAADFTAPSGLMVDASGDLTTQAVGNGWFVMDVTGLYEIKIKAKSSAAGGSTLQISGGGV